MMIFDSHAHYDDEAFDGDREELLGGMQGGGIGYVVNVAADLASVRTTAGLAQRWPFIYGALGVHPSSVEELDEEGLAWLSGMLSGEKIVAVGEIGLDYHWDTPSRPLQREWFARQLALAKEHGLPVVIHSRDAAQETFDILRSEHGGSTGGVIHCYSGSREMARDYLNMGYYLGIGGLLTFKNVRVLREVVEYAPLERLVVETDCPYLAPVPYRGKRNSSLNLPFVIEKIAEIKGITPGEVEEATFWNAKKLYRIGI